MYYHKNFSLKYFNSFGVESLAKEVWFPQTLDELIKLVKKLRGCEFKILAGGTNVILTKNIDKIICLKYMEQILIPLGNQDSFLISTSYPFTNFINEVIKKRLSGIEGLIGIPGTIGGAIIMNSGSGKYCISDYLRGVVTIDLNGVKHHYQKKDLKFKRRYSILQDKKEILISALFTFKKQIPDKKAIEQTIKYRKQFPKGCSAGGIFVNHYALRPYETELRKLKTENLKISKYLNVLISNGRATSDEILDFIEKIKSIVQEPLKLEVKIIGNLK